MIPLSVDNTSVTICRHSLIIEGRKQNDYINLMGCPYHISHNTAKKCCNWFCRVMCCVVSCRVVSCRVVSCRVVSCRVSRVACRVCGVCGVCVRVACRVSRVACRVSRVACLVCK